MTRLLPFIAVLTMLCATAVSAQTTLKATPSQQASLFCDLCKIQGCDCQGGNKCVNCQPGRLTSNTGGNESQQQLNLKATQSVCKEAKGRMSSGQCRMR